jgi:hypothetical protein
LRTTCKNPVFILTVELVLALGIGGNAAMFSIIRAVLLKPLDYRDPDGLELVSVDIARRHRLNSSFTPVRYEEMRNALSFSELGAAGLTENMTLSGGAEPEPIKLVRVSANFLHKRFVS